MDLVRIVAAIAGIFVVACSFYWTAQVMMVRGAQPPYMARVVLRGSRNLLHLASAFRPDPIQKHSLWALYVPFSLIMVVLLSLALSCVGFALFLYGITENSLREALINSISSMSVIGFAGLPDTLRETIVAGFEAFTGPIFVALLIGYIVNIYAAYSQQRDTIATMDIKLDGSNDGAELIEHAAAGAGLESLTEIWSTWADEYASIEQIYRTVDGYLLIFAPVMTKHWTTDAPMVFDAANIRNTLVTLPPDPEAARCLLIGSNVIHHIAAHFHHRVFAVRHGSVPRIITQDEFNKCAGYLRALGVPTTDDLVDAWERFQKNRESYASATTRLQRMQTGSHKY